MTAAQVNIRSCYLEAHQGVYFDPHCIRSMIYLPAHIQVLGAWE